mgnify:CR=1 FL=1
MRQPVFTIAGNIFTNAISSVVGARDLLPNLSQNTGRRLNGADQSMNEIGSFSNDWLEGSSFSSYSDGGSNLPPPNSDSDHTPELDSEDLISWIVDELKAITNIVELSRFLTRFKGITINRASFSFQDDLSTLIILFMRFQIIHVLILSIMKSIVQPISPIHINKKSINTQPKVARTYWYIGIECET